MASFYERKTQLKKAHLGLLTSFILFFATLATSFLKLEILSKILFCLCFPALIYTWF